MSEHEYGFCSDCGATVKVKVLPQDRAQARVAAAVAQRGYRNGWTAELFMARQLVKLAEELAEAASHVALPVAAGNAIRKSGNICRITFDDHHLWDDEVGCLDENLPELRSELADLQVVLFNLAEAIQTMDGEPFNIVAAALAKAEKDIDRGVREDHDVQSGYRG